MRISGAGFLPKSLIVLPHNLTKLCSQTPLLFVVSFWFLSVVWWHRLDINAHLLLRCTQDEMRQMAFSCTSLTISSPAMVRSGSTSLSVHTNDNVVVAVDPLPLLFRLLIGQCVLPLTGYFATSWFGVRLTACVCGWDDCADDFLRIPTCVWRRPKPESEVGHRPCTVSDHQSIRVAHTANMQEKKLKKVCCGSCHHLQNRLSANGTLAKICVYMQCISL